MTGYEAFCLYTGLKLHFTSSYDFFKYNGKVKVTVDAFDNRKDKYYFHRIARKYNKDEFVEFLVANFLEDPGIWIGKLLDEEAKERYLRYQRVMQSLGYIFEEDCKSLFESVDNPNDLLKTEGEHPILLKKALRNEVSLQTVFILNEILKFVPKWKEKISDTIIWPNFENRLNKYSGFIRVELIRYKLILKKIIS